MENETVRLNRSIDIFRSLAGGIDPFTNEAFVENNFFNDARMVRCLYFVIDMLEKLKTGEIGPSSRNNLPFVITPEEKSNVVLPAEKIGVNAFAKCVNMVIDPQRSKKLTGASLNVQLKKMGILGEEKDESGRIHTVTNNNSANYGIDMVRIDYNGNTYDKVVFDDKGKKYLMDNLEEIMSCS